MRIELISAPTPIEPNGLCGALGLAAAVCLQHQPLAIFRFAPTRERVDPLTITLLLASTVLPVGESEHNREIWTALSL
jgi:hypothetical protein